MPTEGRGRLYKTKKNKCLIYLAKDLCEDSMFPFKNWGKSAKAGTDSISVKVSFKMGGKTELLIEEWTEPDEGATDEERRYL